MQAIAGDGRIPLNPAGLATRMKKRRALSRSAFHVNQWGAKVRSRLKGSPTWTRTRNLAVNSRSLYQLSYRGKRSRSHLFYGVSRNSATRHTITDNAVIVQSPSKVAWLSPFVDVDPPPAAARSWPKSRPFRPTPGRSTSFKPHPTRCPESSYPSSPDLNSSE